MSSYVSVLLGLALCCLHYTSAQVPFPGGCSKVQVVDKFDLDRYMGTWYEYSKYPFIFELGQKCQQAVYKNEGNDTISVVNTGVYVLINKPNSAVGTAKVIGPGKLAVSFKDQNSDTPNYLILGTDYDNWVVVYSCREITSFSHTKLLWILTRQRAPSEEAINAAKKIIKDNQLSETFLIKSTQTDCPDLTEEADGGDQAAEASTSTERVIETA